MRIVACLLLAVVAMTAGCTGPPGSGRAAAACQGDGPDVWGALDTRTAQEPADPETDPRQGWMTVAALRGDASFAFAVESGAAHVTMFGNATGKIAVIDVPAPSHGPLALTITADGIDCRRFGGGEWAWGDVREGATAAAGKGAIVRTAGFLEDGSLFYTNMPEIHDGPRDGEADQAWPRVGWYEWSGEAPLHVYVYEGAANEMPAHWGAGNDVGPLTGPLASNVPPLPGQYFPTIKGFNEALKGVSTSTVKVVHVPPEQAYTRAGYEDHPLYGKALIFLIQVVAVADQPCNWESTIPTNTLGPVAAPGCFRR